MIRNSTDPLTVKEEACENLGGHASSAPPMVVNAVQWGSPFTFYSKSDTFYSCVFIVISHSHFLAGTWFETGGGLRLVVCLTVTSSELW